MRAGLTGLFERATATSDWDVRVAGCFHRMKFVPWNIQLPIRYFPELRPLFAEISVQRVCSSEPRRELNDALIAYTIFGDKWNLPRRVRGGGCYIVKFRKTKLQIKSELSYFLGIFIVLAIVKKRKKFRRYLLKRIGQNDTDFSSICFFQIGEQSHLKPLNLLRWKDVPRTSRIFSPKIAIFPQF